MRPFLKMLQSATLGLALIAAATLATTTRADAHHHAWAWAGAAVLGAVALGALATPYYYAPRCWVERRIVRTSHGRVWRNVRVCA